MVIKIVNECIQKLNTVKTCIYIFISNTEIGGNIRGRGKIAITIRR